MGKEMNTGNLIRKYIGEGIAPFKFEYAGYRGDSWKFEKKFGRITQTISIYVYRFDKTMLSFELYTDARGAGMVTAVDIEGIEFNSSIPGFWKYENNEESLIEILNQIKDVLIRKGIKLLKDLSVEPKIVATNEMYHELYANCKQLNENFIKKTKLEVTGFNLENINCWFDVMDERVAVLCRGEFEDAKDELIEMAAFLGEQLVKYVEGEWSQYVRKDFESCVVHKIKSNTTPSLNCLTIVVGCYKDGVMDWARDTILEIYETKTN